MKIYDASYLNFVCTKKTQLRRKPLAPNAVHTKCERRHIPDSFKGPSKRGGKP